MSSSTASSLAGVVVGVDTNGSSTAKDVNVSAQWKASRASSSRSNELRVFYPDNGTPVAAVSLGEQKAAPTTTPDLTPSETTFLRNEQLERVRLAAAKGVKAIRDLGAGPEDKGDAPVQRNIGLDTMSSPHAAATGANLGLWTVNHFKTRGKNAAHGKDATVQGGKEINVVPVEGAADEAAKKQLKDAGDDVPSVAPLSWYTGEVYAEAQNWARELKETPANLMTPTIFGQRVTAAFKNVPNTTVIVRDEDWAREQRMNTFLSVAAGTDEPAKFVEIIYKGAPDNDARSVGFVGKGIVFDSGGISLKPGAGMKAMRADMGGAAAVVATVLAIAKLGLPINVVCATPLTENMPSGKATKPGDIIVSRLGHTVEVDNTDAEGRLVLSDALTYVSETYKPHTLIDVATLTGACMIAVGDVYSAAFTESDSLWNELRVAGEAENDLFWRLPLNDAYLKQISTSNADLCNTGGRLAGASTAAIFLKQFVVGLGERGGAAPSVRYAHLDIAGSMEATPTTINDYQPKGFTGRPVRALIEFARRIAANGGAN
ncbi:probable Cytosol aminopeptidase [Sporisorium reilianum f. sp. reilianum]|uniref:leucyl aminopeptidase n=1 Tax=Sporisorium reilianum f. sp. reilianum TaxID=72559 RepID=A0A2N8UEY3_9BASI|nr:probable Cytosol aminopeptidase [Sporisorium reilianum f. sp. reilianum]